MLLWNARARNTHVEATSNHSVPAQIDTDRSFTVDFGEFAQLLKRMVDGRLQVDASLMHRSFVGSIGVERLKAEVDAMHHGGPQGSKRERNSQLQRLRSRPFSTRFG